MSVPVRYLRLLKKKQLKEACPLLANRMLSIASLGGGSSNTPPILPLMPLNKILKRQCLTRISRTDGWK